jgi:hypothetical protein
MEGKQFIDITQIHDSGKRSSTVAGIFSLSVCSHWHNSCCAPVVSKLPGHTQVSSDCDWTLSL